MNTLLVMWLALAIVFIIIEVLTAQIVTIWFAVGAIGAIIANVVNANSTVQLIVFVALSIVTLIVARPFLKKFTKSNIQPTNLDMCIGKDAVVIEEINNIQGSGQAKIRGIVWTARSINDEMIPVNSLVTVKEIEGAKLIVEKK